MLSDSKGAIVDSRQVGGGTPVGSRGPDRFNLAVREPGDYKITVRFSDGVEKSASVTVGTEPRQQVAIDRE